MDSVQIKLCLPDEAGQVGVRKIKKERKGNTVITGILFDGKTGEKIEIEEADEFFYAGMKDNGMEIGIQAGYFGSGMKAKDSLNALGKAVVKILFECAGGDEKRVKNYLAEFLKSVIETDLEPLERPKGQS